MLAQRTLHLLSLILARLGVSTIFGPKSTILGPEKLRVAPVVGLGLRLNGPLGPSYRRLPLTFDCFIKHVLESFLFVHAGAEIPTSMS